MTSSTLLLDRPETQLESQDIHLDKPLDGVIRRMFEAIDSRDFARLPDFFHPRVTYERPGYAVIDGLPALTHFYENIRIIAEGRHTVHSVFVSGASAAAACGLFVGRSRSGEPLNEQFCDVYAFEAERIVRRKTFFFRKAI
ncbi:nuclear transport factor 2 family protein [Burkholderia gladioli]|uniref:nuclear transport factor 2 family protein n=1 Tax=Burkholderia gladioli TaxID=28095 RepID=UPI00164100FD|nr:nuclear transport factor 2 family protein [Burkholderia gladioli]